MTFDTSKAKREIFQRIRGSQRRGAPGADDEAAAGEYLARHPAGPQPAPYEDRLAQFRATAERMASSVELVQGMAEAPAAIARYLAAQAIAPDVIAWPALRDLPWTGAGVRAEFRPPRRDESHGSDLVGITGAFCAIAETGTLVLLSGADTPASMHLLPETHIALLHADRIVNTMEDAFQLLRRERGGSDRMMPRAVNMVSGPSRTGDIEQTIVIGAHGPYRVHIIIATSA